MPHRFLFLFYFLFLLTSCRSDVLYKKETNIPNHAWEWKDTLDFKFHIPDTNARYALDLDVFHSVDYSFQNLYTQFHTFFPSGKKETRLVSLELASPIGLWNGKCSRKKCKVTIPLQSKVHFPEVGTYRIDIEQYMRQNPLPGIYRMRLTVKKI